MRVDILMILFYTQMLGKVLYLLCISEEAKNVPGISTIVSVFTLLSANHGSHEKKRKKRNCSINV